MKKIIIISVIVLIIISVFLSYPKIKESYIKNEIKLANYCDIDSDCVDAGGKCPFGCYVYVNKNEVERISSLIGLSDPKCVYGCLLCEEVKCENNKCIEVCE